MAGPHCQQCEPESEGPWYAESAPRDGDALRMWRPQCGRHRDQAALTALGMLDHQEEDLTTGRNVRRLFDAQLDQAICLQQHRGLLVDGIVGEATYRVLERSLLPARGPRCTTNSAPRSAGDDVATAWLQDLSFYTGLVDGHFGFTDPQCGVPYQREYGCRRRYLRPRNVLHFVLSKFASQRWLATCDSRRELVHLGRARS